MFLQSENYHYYWYWGKVFFYVNQVKKIVIELSEFLFSGSEFSLDWSWRVMGKRLSDSFEVDSEVIFLMVFDRILNWSQGILLKSLCECVVNKRNCSRISQEVINTPTFSQSQLKLHFLICCINLLLTKLPSFQFPLEWHQPENVMNRKLPLTFPSFYSLIYALLAKTKLQTNNRVFSHTYKSCKKQTVFFFNNVWLFLYSVIEWKKINAFKPWIMLSFPSQITPTCHFLRIFVYLICAI